MTRLPQGRREVTPSKDAAGNRPGVSFGTKLNISVPLSIGLPLIVVGLFLIVTAATRSGGAVVWVAGGVTTLVGVMLFASGKRL
jgi:hypothetical protein